MIFTPKGALKLFARGKKQEPFLLICYACIYGSCQVPGREIKR
jgi:hypothetical protein